MCYKENDIRRLKHMTKGEREHRRQLKKVAELTWKNVDELSPIDRERLRLDLYEFQLSAGVGMHYVQAETDTTREELSAARVPDRFVKEMVDGLRETLVKFAKAREFPLRITTKPKDIEFNVYLGSPSMEFSLHANMEPGKEAAVYALLKHFEFSGLGVDRVKFCPRDECRNVFVLGSYARTDRMRYCSVRCSRLAAVTAYRERQAEKARKLKAKKAAKKRKGKGRK
jgi:hypothetical protein